GMDASGQEDASDVWSAKNMVVYQNLCQNLSLQSLPRKFGRYGPNKIAIFWSHMLGKEEGSEGLFRERE
ncbi:hypothetical protein ACJX0J_030642, partial [Zea mays]